MPWDGEAEEEIQVDRKGADQNFQAIPLGIINMNVLGSLWGPINVYSKYGESVLYWGPC